MEVYTVAMFGEAEKGEYQTAYFLDELPQLIEFFGNPPPQSQGLYFAIQALLFKRNLIFFRVKEEGYSYQDYLTGISVLGEQTKITDVNAVCLPGVGDLEIIDAAIPYCKKHHSIIITTEPDLYDYLTETKYRFSA